MLSPLQPTKENTPSLLVVTTHGYQTRYQSRNVNSTVLATQNSGPEGN